MCLSKSTDGIQAYVQTYSFKSLQEMTRMEQKKIEIFKKTNIYIIIWCHKMLKMKCKNLGQIKNSIIIVSSSIPFIWMFFFCFFITGTE